MNKKTLSRNEMSDLATELVEHLKTNQILTLTGPLGAGKTTLVQETLKQLGVTEPVISPTYTYVNLYKLKNGKKIYHFDLYRLSSADEFIAAGFNEYLFQPNSYVFIEWPEVINSFLNKGVVQIELEHQGDDTRLVSVILKR